MQQSSKSYAVSIFILLMMTSCEGILFDDDPKDSPENNFDLLWNDFDKTYSFFEIKDINWDSVYQVYRPKVNSQSSNIALFNVMSEMLSTLKDGHVSLYANDQMSFHYDLLKDKPVNFPGLPSLLSKYIRNYQNNGIIGFGSINSDVGYITISSFGGGAEKYVYIDIAIEYLANKKGLIIDLRNNVGGNDTNTKIISSRFVDQKRLFRYVRFKKGPSHDDFTDFIPDYIDKGGNSQFTGPVILLTNRSCFSSTEFFILQMKTLSKVTTVGDTTGGSAGNPVGRELPNGWSYQLPRWIQYRSDKTSFEGKGLEPDIPIWITAQDQHDNIDAILEKAIELLQ